jgi:amino acid adenylation domain-containing protein
MPELLQDWVTVQAGRRPGAVAVALKGEALRYGELETISNQLAATLKEAGCRRGDRVGLLMPKSPMAIAAVIGIYKADCVYVPLDPAGPAARLAMLVGACGARCLLASGVAVQVLDEVLRLLQSGEPPAIGWMDERPAGNVRFTTTFSLQDVRNACGAPPSGRASRGGDAAHILFTSGSTGTPKGVVITHANVVRFVEWATRYFGMSSADRVSGHPPLHFDLSVFDIFGSFAAGAALHLVPAEASLLPNKLAEWIRASGVTQWFSVPSALQYMASFDVVGFNDFPALKRLLWCGEVLPTSSLVYWMKRLPHVRFTNLYGPTETTIASSYYTVPRCPEDERVAIPIGSPCEGEELLVLNEALRPVPPGEAGDLYIRGAGLSPGYWNDPDKTRQAFFPAPGGVAPSDRIYRTGDLARVGDDGLVYFLGRADSQIKSRGYRIELGEIEAALNATGIVAECAVVAVAAGGFENVTICCAYSARDGRDVTPAELRTQLRAIVPGYMIPSRWMALRELPKNVNGKIDRRALKEALQEHAADADLHA